MLTSDKDLGGCPSLTPTFYGVGLYSEWLVRALHNLYNLLFVSQCTFTRTHSLGLVCLGRLGFSDLSPLGLILTYFHTIFSSLKVIVPVCF